MMQFLFMLVSVYSSALHGESEANTSRDDKRIVVILARANQMLCQHSLNIIEDFWLTGSLRSYVLFPAKFFTNLSESVDFLSRDGADAQYTRYANPPKQSPIRKSYLLYTAQWCDGQGFLYYLHFYIIYILFAYFLACRRIT